MVSKNYRDYYGALKENKRYHMNAGSRKKQEYLPVYDSFGVWHLEKTKESDLYLDIQSFADSCDINVLMARYRNGETDVLSRVQGFYGDVSNIPSNYAELMNTKLQAEALFNGLSADVREKYNNSVEQFMSEIGTQAGLEKLGVKFDEAGLPIQPSVEVEKEGVVNES